MSVGCSCLVFTAEREEGGGSVPVADEDDQWQTVAQLVRTGGCLGSIRTAELVKQPVGWR